MSKIKELYEKVANDKDLQAKFNAIIGDAEKAGEAATGEKLDAFAKEAGFDVTLEEMKDFFRQHAVKGNSELSDADLDMVAGGKGGEDIANSIWSIGIGC